MDQRFTELRCREVINICDGCRLGYVGDLELRIPEGEITALIVPGPLRFFGLFGRGEEYYIPWRCIKRIGDDVILIEHTFPRREGEAPPRGRKRRF
ncbi:MAG: YlmC/YmxH family sporulation protein [Ruminococcaceae bacterium]|nr:YlmC/YmxH family sporulation protein [Oscillospiraceae bacterium]